MSSAAGDTLGDGLSNASRACRLQQLLSLRNAARALYLDRFETCAKIAHRERHSGVPGGIASELRRVVRNNHSREVVLFQNAEDAKNIDVAFIDVRLSVLGHFATHVPHVNVSDAVLGAVPLNRVVDIAVPHLGDCSHAAFKLIRHTAVDVNEFLIKVGTIH